MIRHILRGRTIIITGFLLIAIVTTLSVHNKKRFVVNKSNAIDSLLKVYIENNKAKAISVGVFDFEQDSVFQWIQGVSHENQKATKDMLWGIGSSSKTFTSVVILKLVEDGLLNLEDEIGKYIPVFENINPKITIRQILQHQSGLADVYANSYFDGMIDSLTSKRWKSEEVLQFVPKAIGEQGAINWYSGTNYIIASTIIEKVLNIPFNEAVKNYITVPLGLKHTYVHGFDSINEISVHPWVENKDVYIQNRTSISTSCMGSGAMVSSASDMVRWYDALFNRKFLSDYYYNEFLSFKPWDFDRFYQYVGLGIFKIEREGKVYYGHGGSVFGYYSFTLYDLESKNSIVVMTTGNFKVAEELSYRVAELFENNLK